MKKTILFFLIVTISFFAYPQKFILPHEKPDNVSWNGGEKEYYSNIWQTKVVTNVSVPTLELFRPDPAMHTGTAVIIAPGGGLYAHSIENEGSNVARWLAQKGITAFVLKYRLVPTGEDGVAEISKLGATNPGKIREEVGKVMPLSVADGLQAIAHVRKNAEVLKIDPKKIGFMGFSAGGAVTMGVAYYYTPETRPDFLVPVYAWTDAMPVQKPKQDSPPILLVCASDDPLNLAPGSIEIYNSWYKQGLRVALHMYSKGGHGFGMKEQGLPSDTWIQRCYEWAIAEGLITKK